MIGVYVNTGTGRMFIIIGVVPGTQYKITAWALASGTRRSATPAVEYVTLREASELPLCTATYVRMLTQSNSTPCYSLVGWISPAVSSGRARYLVQTKWRTRPWWGVTCAERRAYISICNSGTYIRN